MDAEAPLPMLPAKRAAPVTIAPLSGWPAVTTVEPAGRPYELLLLALHGLSATGGDEEEDKAEAGKAAAGRGAGAGGRGDKPEGGKRRERGKKLAEDELQQDHYAVLGLDALGVRASDEQIRIAYKRMILETHPDKTKDRDDTKFKAVQAAFDVLSDKMKRKAYDSSLPFDDTIPPAKVPPEQFFEVFGPVFDSNARWSISRDVPGLGDDATSYADLDRFYDFWFNFKSWREFDVEHDPEMAECREERRWMEKENERERTKLRRQENQRILNLVERAFKLDPRLKRRREVEEQQKQEARERRQREKAEQERQAQREEERRRKQEEKERKQEERRLKLELEQRQALIRGLLADLTSTDATRPRQLADDCIHRDDLTWLLGKLDPQRTGEVAETLAKIGEDRQLAPDAPLPRDAAPVVLEYLNTTIMQIEQARGLDRHGKALGADADAGKGAKGKDHWTEEELNDLTRAIVKWPGGCAGRWDNIAAFIGTKSAEQVLKKTKELTAQLNARVAPKKPEQMKQSDATAARILDEGKKKEEEDIWTKAQQQELEAALKQLRDYKEKDKWEKIAELVTGKTKAQCVARYKFLAGMNKK